IEMSFQPPSLRPAESLADRWPKLAYGSPLRDRDLQWELVDHIVAVLRHDKRVPEEDPERAVGGDRVGLCHGDHAGLEHHVDRLAPHMLGAEVAVIGDEVDAVALRRPRLHALVAEEFAGDADVLSRLAGRDFGDDALVARERDLLPEFSHHLGRLADADRRADLR